MMMSNYRGEYYITYNAYGDYADYDEYDEVLDRCIGKKNALNKLFVIFSIMALCCIIPGISIIM
jgi:hypothetical protein